MTSGGNALFSENCSVLFSGAFFGKYFLTYFAYFLIYYETLHHSSASEPACRLIVISGEGLQDFRKSVLTYAKPK